MDYSLVYGPKLNISLGTGLLAGGLAKYLGLGILASVGVGAAIAVPLVYFWSGTMKQIR